MASRPSSAQTSAHAAARAIPQYFWRAFEYVLRSAPPRIASRIDWLRPALRAGWGGPLNGQVERQKIVRALFRSIAFGQVVETGAFRGNSTEFFAQVSGLPVTTIEHNLRYADYTRRRCSIYQDVTVHVGDSREHLRTIAPAGDGPAVFYYLDAHWGPDLPLRAELEIIRSTGRPAVIMIDDFQVPDDPGYSYDDYGPGASLVPEILRGLGLEQWPWLVPQAPSSAETGAARGCVVLVHPALADRAAESGLLRAMGVAQAR
ncbi:MAG: hypothetical protein ACR2LF_02200 [Jatrophihabitantaceae bacterium]